jgi:hypothetical protein
MSNQLPSPPRPRTRGWLKWVGGLLIGLGAGLLMAWQMLNYVFAYFYNLHIIPFFLPYENYALYQLLSALFGIIMLISGLLITAYALTRS